MIYEELVSELRKRKGKNGGYSAIARRLLVTPNYISDVSRCTRGMTLRTAEDLANAMGFDLVLVKRDETGRSDTAD